MIRSLQLGDFAELKRIHEKFYEREFEFPDFVSNYLCAFTIVENNRIITVGGLRTITEMIAMTDKDVSVRKRRKALFEMLSAAAYISGRHGYNQIHAFVQDKTWEKQLIKADFRPCKGTALYINV